MQAQKRTEKVNNNLEKLITSLITIGVNADIAEKSAIKSIKNCKGDAMTELMALALKYSDEFQGKKESKRVKKSNTDFLLQKLFDKASINKVSNYEVLKEAGYIKSPIDEFVI